MITDTAFTPERIDALNAVDLQLFGVTHGMIKKVNEMPFWEQITDNDYSGLAAAASKLNVERGDVLASEPTGFMSDWVDGNVTLADVIPADVPTGPVADMSQEVKTEMAELLEYCRSGFHMNNLAYTAGHAVLRGVPVRFADVSEDEWQRLQKLLPELAPPDGQKEIKLFYRNTKMLAHLGDIAIDMKSGLPDRPDNTPEIAKPVLLFSSGGTHTPRLGKRLRANGVNFTAKRNDIFLL